MKPKLFLSLMFMAMLGTVTAAPNKYCLTNAYGEQTSLVFARTGPGTYSVTGKMDYTAFGSTIWPISGTYTAATKKLHYVATNPNPDFCTYFASTVTFDYVVSGLNLTGSFSNDCGVYGDLTASGIAGKCSWASVSLKPGEYGATGASKMKRSPLPLPKGESLDDLLKGISISVVPNPAKQYAQVSFTLEAASKVQVNVYDRNGNLTRTIAQGLLNAGTHNYSWNLKSNKGQSVPHGIYWIKVISEDGIASKQILVE